METPEEMALGLGFLTRGVKPEHQADILSYLKILRNRDEATYLHSIRVGLLVAEIAAVANIPGITPKMMLWAGLLHDIGKTLVATSVLTKTQSFTTDDFAAIEPHVKYGCDMLSSVHDYTAHIIVRHHRFGPKPYPAVLPPLPDHLKDKECLINEAARLLALADYFDALMRRKNDKFGGMQLNAQQKREKYMQGNADMADLIVRLEAAGVLNFSE